MGLMMRWIGHGSFMLETSMGRVIFLDPWLDGNPASTMKLKDITKADIVCVTHGHVDHLGDSIEIVRKTGAVFVSTPEICFFAQKKGIPLGGKDGGICALNIGGSAIIRGVEVIMTNAVHTSDIMISEVEETVGSGACGFILVSEDGIRVYFAGDTGVFSDMEIIGRLYSPHVAIMPVGGKYNMGIREAAYASHLIRPDAFIPMHYGTFPDQRADIRALSELLKYLAPATKLIVLKPGESVSYP
ncbi:metal-dependent hydrolase [Candidatus Bathyarchaeota archaeon]|nr:metal-dependent hydrolase [Candidatus Bathyarchaeota archaeon]